MNSRERVSATIKGEKHDKIPIYAWLFNDEFLPKIIAEYGSRQAAEDKYEFDMAHIFPSFGSYSNDVISKIANLEPPEILDFKMCDPDDMSLYTSIKNDIDFYKKQRGRFCYMQTPGCFEYFNGIFGIQNHLMFLLLYPDELKILYNKLAVWTEHYISNCIELGLDMIHVSDDWGAQNSLLFSLDIWKELVFPYHKQLSDYVHKRGVFLSLHSDGNVMSVLDGICDIGYDVVHPFQVSAGMNYDTYFQKYKDKFTILGGLDVQSTIGFGDYERLECEIRENLARFKDGGMLFCTTHMIQPHCSIEEFKFAFDLVKKING